MHHNLVLLNAYDLRENLSQADPERELLIRNHH